MLGRQFNKKKWFLSPLDSPSRALWSITITTFSSLLMLGFLIWINYSLLLEINQRTSDVNRSYQIRLINKDLIRILVDIETGQRGFLLTGDDYFLQPYYDGKKRLKSTQLDLRNMLVGNDVQLIWLDSLNKFIDRRIAKLDSNLLNKKYGRSIEGLRVGKSYMEKIRFLSKQIEDEEILLLLNYNELHQKADQQMNKYLIVLSGVSVLFLLIFFRLLYIELKRRIQAQKDLENNIAELQHANQELEQFAFVASHDLQEPLRKIRTFGERLNNKYSHQLPDDAQTLLYKMGNSASRMQQLINDLLTFSRASNNAEIKTETINLNEILQQSKIDLEASITDKNAVIKNDNLPVIDGIKTQLEQLFSNLLSNSLKYTRTNITPHISITYKQVKGREIDGISKLLQENNYHRITFMDNGIGFEKQYAEKVFVLFQRLHSKNEYQGTGIGLALCRRIVTNHNGYIVAEVNENHQGAIFHVYLPL